MQKHLRSIIDRGFTLVEVIIAVAIVGVLAGIAIPVTVAQLSQGNRGTADQDGAAWAVSIGNALSGYSNLGNAAPNTTSAITLTGNVITVTMSTPSPTTLPSTVTVPVAVTSGSTIYRSGIGTTHWCIQVKNSTESFVFNETGQVPSATTCLADGTTDGNAQAQTGKAVPGVPGLVTPTLPDAAIATIPGGLNPYNTATISWVAPTPGDAAISKYVVTTYPGGAQCQTTGALTCSIPGLTAGNSYAFNVVASNVYGSGLPSDLSANITVARAPSAPTALSSMWTSTGALNIGWTAAANNGAAITGSTVQVSTSSTFATGVTTVTVTGNATSASATGLTVGSTYYYRVKSTNAAGDSSYTASDTTQSVIPTPTGLTYTNVSTPNYGTNRMSWNPVTCIAGFTPEYYLNQVIQNGTSGTFNNSGWITGTNNGTTLYYDLPAAWTVQGSTYGFQITARCTGSGVTSIASPYSPTTTFNTVIAAPAAASGLTHSDSQTASTLSWAPVTCATGTTAQYLVYQNKVDGNITTPGTLAMNWGTATSVSLPNFKQGNDVGFTVATRCLGPTIASTATTPTALAWRTTLYNPVVSTAVFWYRSIAMSASCGPGTTTTDRSMTIRTSSGWTGTWLNTSVVYGGYDTWLGDYNNGDGTGVTSHFTPYEGPLRLIVFGSPNAQLTSKASCTSVNAGKTAIITAVDYG